MIVEAGLLLLGVLLGTACTTTNERFHMLSKIRRHKLASAVLALTLTASIAVAASFLLSNQGGRGGGKIGHLSNVAVTAQAASDADAVLPGTTNGIAVAQIDNSSNGALHIVAVRENPNDPGVRFVDNPVTCNPSELDTAIDVPTKTGLNINVPAHATTTVKIPAFSVSSTLDGGCADQNFGYGIVLDLAAGAGA